MISKSDIAKLSQFAKQFKPPRSEYIAYSPIECIHSCEIDPRFTVNHVVIVGNFKIIFHCLNNDVICYNWRRDLKRSITE